MFGFALFAIGYAIFYWGIHHMPGTHRYSLWTLLGLDAFFTVLHPGQHLNIPSGPPVQIQGAFGTGTAPADSGGTLSPSNSTTPGPISGNTSGWQAQILAGLGAPNTDNNQKKLTAWNACEGNLGGHSGLGINNPFNTTLNCCGTTGSVNSAGVKAYPTITAGVQATVQTLQSSFYIGIVRNLMSDGSGANFAAAVGTSPWGTSGSCIAGAVR